MAATTTTNHHEQQSCDNPTATLEAQDFLNIFWQEMEFIRGFFQDVLTQFNTSLNNKCSLPKLFPSGTMMNMTLMMADMPLLWNVIASKLTCHFAEIFNLPIPELHGTMEHSLSAPICTQQLTTVTPMMTMVVLPPTPQPSLTAMVPQHPLHLTTNGPTYTTNPQSTTESHSLPEMTMNQIPTMMPTMMAAKLMLPLTTMTAAPLMITNHTLESIDTLDTNVQLHQTVLHTVTTLNNHLINPPTNSTLCTALPLVPLHATHSCNTIYPMTTLAWWCSMPPLVQCHWV